MSDVHFHDGEPLKFKAEFEVAPVVDLNEYRGLVCNYAEPVVTDEDVAQRLEQVRDQKAEFVNEDPRPDKEDRNGRKEVILRDWGAQRNQRKKDQREHGQSRQEKRQHSIAFPP